MSGFDLTNALFEMGGAVMTFANLRRLWIDKQVAGVDWRVVGFWSAWGFWNLAYYPHLGQWLSTAAGAVLALGNTAWVVLYLHLRRQAA